MKHFTLRFADNLTQNSREPELSSYTYTHFVTHLLLVPTYIFKFMVFLYVVQQLNSGLDRLIVEVSSPHTHTHTHTHTKYCSAERVISSSQRPLHTQHISNRRHKHPCPQRDSNPQSQPLSYCWPTPKTSQPPASSLTLWRLTSHIVVVPHL